MRFEFATVTRIVFGTGVASELGTLAKEKGTHALVVTDNNPDRVGNIIQHLTDANVQHTIYSVATEPSIDLVNQGKAKAQSAGCDMVISIGGGSVIDGGKAIAALLPNDGEILDYLEVIGKGQKLKNAPVPFIAVPTTAGTGAEVTKNAVIASPEHRVKVSLRDNRMLADIALVDPILTYSMPQAITASTGMDALTQVLEPYVSHLANPMTDAFCREGLMRAGRSLRTVYDNPNDADAREDMALASLLGGLALANAKLGAVHGFAGPLGGMFSAPHGAICATLLPHVIKANINALQNREPDNPALSRFDEIGQLITGDKSANAQTAIQWIDETSQQFNIPTLSTYGIQESGFDSIIEKSANSSSMKGNPIKLTDAELNNILKSAL
jgi:alcohol dehydrogenase class IV